jgi:Zn-dependent protease
LEVGGKAFMFLTTFFSNPILFFRIVLILIVSITLHELAHGIAALGQGDKTPRITGHMTLNPIVHMGTESILFLCLTGIAWGQMPINPANFRSPRWSNMLVAVAGPLSNLGMALGAIVFLRIISNQSANLLISSEFLGLFAQINLTLCLFNLIPIPPLDGFHVVSAVVPKLKTLVDTNLSYFALTLFFLIPGIGQGLRMISIYIISTMT